nr:dockerin type I repeat-containing protein [Oscillospiraceae bacterium]
MKNIMKKLTAAILALCCLPVAGLTASANVTDWWGSSNWQAFEDMEQVNNRGFSGSKEYPDPAIFVRTEGNGQHAIIRAVAQEDTLCLVLRDEVDIKAAANEIAETLDAYIPGLLAGQYSAEYFEPDQFAYQCDQAKLSNYRRGGSKVCWLDLRTDLAHKEELEADLLLALARKHLISEFYGWGETARYQTGYLDHGYTYEEADDPLSGFWPSYSVENPNSTSDKDFYTEIHVDFEALQAYLDEHYPGYTVETYDIGLNEYDEETGTVMPMYLRRIAGAEDLTFVQKLALMYELEEASGAGAHICFLESGDDTVKGRNSLRKPGDVTLDTDVSIVDVIALNRNIMTGDPLCDTAKKNADINGNGAPDEADALAILKEVVELTD